MRHAGQRPEKSGPVGLCSEPAAWGLSRCSEKGGEGRLLWLPQPWLCSLGKDLSWMSGLWILGYGGSQGWGQCSLLAGWMTK